MINKFICTGRTTGPIEIKSSRSGKAVCDFSLACEEGYGEKKTVEFLDFKAWNEKAELIGRLAKGTMLAIEAKATSDSYTDKNGKKHKNKYFLVQDMHIMSKRNENSSIPTEQSYSSADSSDFEEIIEDDDDLPF